MKRLLIIISTFALLLISAALGRAQDSKNSADPLPTTHAIFSSLLQRAGIKEEITAQDVFGTQPKNLYTYIYQEIFDRPEREALLELASAYGLTPIDAELVIQGSVSPLMRGRQNYTQDDAVRDSRKVMQSYAEILKTRRMKYELAASVTPTEIFANGDLSDSGFDLIHDLDLIEEILFIDKGKVYLNQKPFGSKAISLTPGGKGAGATVSGARGNFGDGALGATNDAASDASNSAKNDNVADTADTSSRTFTFDDLIRKQDRTPTGGPLNRCIVPTPLQKALDEYGRGSTSRTETGGTSGGRSGKSGKSSASAQSDNADLSATPISDIPSPELAIIPVKPEGAFKVPNEAFCSELGGTPIYTYRTKIGLVEKELFCVNLIERMRTYTTFSPERSCIQCMIAGMNESMKALLSKNLIPNKLTGNTYESAKCKSSIRLSNMLDMNIILAPTPVITPQKYGKFAANDIGKMWDKFSKRYLPFSNPQDSSKERIQREALQNLGGGTTDADGKQRNRPSQTDALSEIQVAFSQHMSEIAERNSNLQTDQTSSFVDDMYQQMVPELRQMTAYFIYFKDIFEHFNEETCRALLDKPALDQKE